MFESSFNDGQSPGDSGGNGGTPRAGDASRLAGLERIAPGPELAALVHRIDPESVTDGYDLVEIAAACRRLKAWADAIEVAAAARLARHQCVTRRRPPDTDSPPSERPASCWPPASGWPRHRPATG
jgi:hypothetical protein